MPGTDAGFAPAKINLTLHVTGRRTDGYHLLDSLVVFADLGDRVSAIPADRLTLSVTGPTADGLAPGGDNLVLRAARLLDGGGAAMTLDKHLPVSSGIGGGSSDAAAALRVLSRLWGRPMPAPTAAAALGADVPVCLDPRPRRMAGIGATLSDLPSLPPCWLVLANPGVAVATPAVFAELERHDNPPMPATLPVFADVADLAAFLTTCRNDLEPHARMLEPLIATTSDALSATTGCLIARMSGSGATCYGLYASQAGAEVAARRIGSAYPTWWVRAARMLG